MATTPAKAPVRKTSKAPAGKAAAPTARTASWRDYVTLTKPRIMALLVLTSVCAMVAAAHGAPSLTALAALVVGGASACGVAGSRASEFGRLVLLNQVRADAGDQPLPGAVTGVTRAVY